MGSPITSRLAVVIPAHNEASNLDGCLESVLSQRVPVRALVSDNASTDDTPRYLGSLTDPDRLTIRRVDFMNPTAHFVSCGRWALDSGAEEYVAFLAADDRWQAGFAEACVRALDGDPTSHMAFPQFIWRSGEHPDRVLLPPRLDQRGGVARQLRALALPDRMELANLLYGVFRRDAFEALVSAWVRGGEGLGVDYASVLSVLGRFRSAPVPSAVSVRNVRAGQDLIERAGVVRPTDPTLLQLGTTYLRLNLRINTQIGRAISRVSGRSPAVTVPLTQVARTPQWVAAIPRQLTADRSRRS